jgi:hypothetical protein
MRLKPTTATILDSAVLVAGIRVPSMWHWLSDVDRLPQGVKKKFGK